MLFSNTALLAVIGYAAGITAHGVVKWITINGKQWVPHATLPPFLPHLVLMTDCARVTNYQPHSWEHPATPGWEIPKDQDHGFIDPSKYQDPDIICHVGATPGRSSLTVAAGDSIALQWTTWPISHHGNVVNYLASCQDDFEKVDKTKLKFNKITEKGLIRPNPDIPIGKQIDGTTTGFWAGDQLRDDHNVAWFQVPDWLAAGTYVFRHELMALHSAMAEGSGIQHYPQCINLVVTGSGSDSLESGTLGTDLYRKDEPGVVVNIFRNPGEYTVPGPPVYKPGKRDAAPETSSATPEKTEKTEKTPEKTETPPAKKPGASKQQSYEASSGESVASEKKPLPQSDKTPEKFDTVPAKTSSGASEQQSYEPSLGDSVSSQKKPSPQATSRNGYKNATITSILPQKTSYKDAGVKITKSHQGSTPKPSEVPTPENGNAPDSGTHPNEAVGKSSDDSYDLSSDDSSDTGNSSDLSHDLSSHDASPKTNSKLTSDPKSEPSPGTPAKNSLDISISNLIDLIERALRELRKKLADKKISKRHARDLTL